MKAPERKALRDKSVDELQAQLIELRKEQFKWRMQKASGQLAQVHLLGEARRDIARVKTLIQEKKNG